jgi:hypothetical protein
MSNSDIFYKTIKREGWRVKDGEQRMESEGWRVKDGE